jgi:hypothetical protein
MSDWLLNLPVAWMALVVVVATYLIAGGVYLIVTKLAVNERARAFKAGLARNVTSIGHPFRPAGWLHRRRGLE